MIKNAIYNVVNVKIPQISVLVVHYKKEEVNKYLIVYVWKDIIKMIFYFAKVVYLNADHAKMEIHVQNVLHKMSHLLNVNLIHKIILFNKFIIIIMINFSIKMVK